MPTASKRPCFAPGCKTLVLRGYCAEHSGESYEARREQSQDRGYDHKWKRFVIWFLRLPENVVCLDCKRAPSTEVHHVLRLAYYPELKYDIANLKALCKPCHSTRTGAGE